MMEFLGSSGTGAGMPADKPANVGVGFHGAEGLKIRDLVIAEEESRRLEDDHGTQSRTPRKD
jgi:hypothetical protein